MRKRVRLEEWRPVAGFDGYYVSDQGRIKSERPYDDGRRRRFPIIMRTNKHGSIVLRKDGKGYTFKLSRLILLAFKGEPKEGFDLARHLDDDRSNNRLSNLAWGSYQDNYEDSVRNGTGGPGTPGAIIRGNKLRGRPRPQEVKEKISKTKRMFPERQVYGNMKDKKGRFSNHA